MRFVLQNKDKLYYAGGSPGLYSGMKDELTAEINQAVVFRAVFANGTLRIMDLTGLNPIYVPQGEWEPLAVRLST